MFSTCNSGNPDTYNLAFAFMKKNKITVNLTAWDSGTVFDYDDHTLKASGSNSNPSTWEKHVDWKWESLGHNGLGKQVAIRKRLGKRVLYDKY